MIHSTGSKLMLFRNITQQRASMLYRIASFGAVGLISSAGYLLAMSASVEWLGLPVLTSALIAFCVGTIISYIGNTLVTFRAPVNRSGFARFVIVVLIGMGINQAIAYGLHELGAHYILIALTVFIVVPVINFVGHSLFTYRGASA